MKQDKTFSSLLVFWESEIEGNIEHVIELKNYKYYEKSILESEILESKIRLQLIFEQIDFFKYSNSDDYNFQSIDSLIEKYKQFLKENNIILYIYSWVNQLLTKI
jgi:uncharacterized protein (UPF0305 family)